MPLRHILRGFSQRNFRLFFTGQGLSLIGTQVQIVSLPWFVLRLTGSAQTMAWVSFAGQFPAVLFTPIAGVIADRVDKRRLLLFTQSLAMFQAALLAGLTLSGNVQLWHLVALNVCLGLINAFDLTTRQSMLLELVGDRAMLTNAIALNSAMFNLTRLIGPSIAGLLIGWIGEGGCFLVNATSFLAVLIALWAMQPFPRTGRHAASAAGGLREGISFAVRSLPIAGLLSVVTLVCLFAVPYHVLVPVLIRTSFDGDATLNGAMLSAAGLGALLGGLFLASRTSALGLIRVLGFLPLGAGLAFLGLSFAPTLWLCLPLAFVIGLCVVMTLTMSNIIIQSIVPNQLRGRIVGLYAMTFLGMTPLGGLAARAMADYLGVHNAFSINGGVLIALGLLFALGFGPLLGRRARAMHAATHSIREPDEVAANGQVV